MANRYARQLDLIDPTKVAIPITIVGAGGIGSWTTLALAQMGCSNLFVYDFDIVEDHNVASQCYKETQLGELKIDALQKNVKEQTGIEIYPYEENILNVDIKTELIILAVDSMDVRRQIAKKYKGTNKYIIDGRMGGLQMEIYSMPAKIYPKTIVPDEEVEVDACTARAICFNCLVISGMIANKVRQFINKDIESECMIHLFNNNTFLKKKF